MYRIGKTFKFEAAHFLPNADSECCRNIHGHSYKVEVVLQSEELINDMVLDFCHLSRWWETIHEKWDHAIIVKESSPTAKNKTVVLGVHPTAEHMARHLWYAARNHLGPSVWVESVKVWETETSWAEYRP